MQYLPPVQRQAPQPQQVPSQGAGKYHGPVAQNYDAKREHDAKWVCEQRVIEGMLSDLPKGSIVLDCPVGTGRFLPFYMEQGFKFIGADLSGDMLIQSALKLGASKDNIQEWVNRSDAAKAIIPLDIDEHGTLLQGDIRKIGLEAKAVDAAVMVRLTRWLSPEDCQVALKELQRVCRSRIIWTARVANHQHARSMDLFEAALDGWKITRNEAGYVMDYRILMAEPV